MDFSDINFRTVIKLNSKCRCVFCGRKHPSDAPCSTQKNAGLFKTSTEQFDCNAQFIVPVYLNNRCINALRDSGNSPITLVDSRLVELHQIVAEETIQLRGAFNDEFVEKPVAIVDFRSPHFACNQNIRVKVAVSALHDNLQCIIGNTLFTQYSQFQDIISVHTHGRQGSSGCDTGGDGQLAVRLVNATPRLINRETQEQASGGVDLSETVQPINITDRPRRRPVDEGTLFSEPTAVDMAERPAAAGHVINTHGSHTSRLDGYGQWLEGTATRHTSPSTLTRPEPTHTSETNTDWSR